MTLHGPNTTAALLSWLLFSTALLLALVALAPGQPFRRERRRRRKLADVKATYGMADRPSRDQQTLSALIGAIATIGALLARSGLLSAKSLAALKATLGAAGYRDDSAIYLFVGCKAVLIAVLPLLSWVVANQLHVSATSMRLTLAGAAIIGLLCPDFVVRTIRKHYLASVEKAIPDALDLLVICAEAGLALEQGMERVAREIRISSAPCATELSLTTDELRILADRRTALVNMGRRTGLVSLQRLGGTLVQALQYGTPLSKALRTLAAEMRADALTRFEARASRLPVLMTVPMILFILPCVFLVVAGPAMINLIATLSQ